MDADLGPVDALVLRVGRKEARVESSAIRDSDSLPCVLELLDGCLGVAENLLTDRGGVARTPDDLDGAVNLTALPGCLRDARLGLDRERANSGECGENDGKLHLVQVVRVRLGVKVGALAKLVHDEQVDL